MRSASKSSIIVEFQRVTRGGITPLRRWVTASPTHGIVLQVSWSTAYLAGRHSHLPWLQAVPGWETATAIEEAGSISIIHAQPLCQSVNFIISAIGRFGAIESFVKAPTRLYVRNTSSAVLGDSPSLSAEHPSRPDYHLLQLASSSGHRRQPLMASDATVQSSCSYMRRDTRVLWKRTVGKALQSRRLVVDSQYNGVECTIAPTRFTLHTSHQDTSSE